MEPVYGGCIHNCYRITSSAGWHFLKMNNGAYAASMFECEEKGLRLLNGTIKGIAPEVLSRDSQKDFSMMLMEWIEHGKAKTSSWHHFAMNLAMLHRQTQPSFGLDHDNYIGSLPQVNSMHPDWIDFLIVNRLEPQLRKAIDDHKLPAAISGSFHKLFLKCHQFFPEEQPALLHGDLWHGNILPGPDGKIRMVDPAVYFGHREMDLAMSRLFGAFDAAFYEQYDESYPVEPDIEERFPVQQLYPLLVHVNLFGGSYSADIISILKRIA